MDHANVVLKTIWNMLNAGDSDADIEAFYRAGMTAHCACPAPVTNVAKPKLNAALEEQFRKPWPGAPSEAPAAAQPRTNATANTPIGLLAQFRESWPGAPVEAKR